jgi:hypothetical protein
MNSARPLTAQFAATSLSGPAPRAAWRSSRRAARASLARSSLCLVALMMAFSSCLVTSTPDFTPPQRTRPFLVPSSADPDTRGVILIDTLEHPGSQTSIEFSADVVSEDQGAMVQGVLYIDYGKASGDKPFAEAIQIRDLPPSTLTDPAKRNMRVTWNVKNSVLGPGCHSVTLLVSHNLDRLTSCPVCRNDSSQITWQVYGCGLASAATCVPDFSDCQTQNLDPGCGVAADPDPDAAAVCGALP